MPAMLIYVVLVVVVINTLAVAGGWWYLRKLSRRFLSALGDINDTNSLAAAVKSYFKKLNTTDSKLRHINSSYSQLSAMAGTSFQKMAIVRFNPFRHTGGNQSFVLALLDSHDSGFLLTSIHSREGTRVYIKPVVYGSSEHNLSHEEGEALEQAARSPAKIEKVKQS